MVADAQVEQRDLIGIVERGPFDHRSGQQHGSQIGHRGDRPRPSDRELHRKQFGERLLRLELIGHRPAGCLGRGSQPPLDVVTVHLDHRPVRGIGQPLAQGVRLADEGLDLFPGPAAAHVVGNAEAPRARLVQRIPMGVEGQILPRHGIEKTVEPARRNHRRVLELQRTGRRIARIGKGHFADLLTLGIQPGKFGPGHVDFATHLEIIRIIVAREHQRHAADGPHVGRHVVPHRAVTACLGTQQPAVFVGQGNGRAVELELADKIGFGRLFPNPVVKFAQLLQRIGIGEGHHRIAVTHALEPVGQVAAHAARRRIGIIVLGILLFKILQAAHQFVELTVADHGIVVQVVAAVVLFELGAQPVDLFFRGCHGCIRKPARNPPCRLFFEL